MQLKISIEIKACQDKKHTKIDTKEVSDKA